MEPEKKPAPSRVDFDLHVLLIMRQEKATKSVALFRAWSEGPTGLNDRLAKR